MCFLWVELNAGLYGWRMSFWVDWIYLEVINCEVEFWFTFIGLQFVRDGSSHSAWVWIFEWLCFCDSGRFDVFLVEMNASLERLRVTFWVGWIGFELVNCGLGVWFTFIGLQFVRHRPSNLTTDIFDNIPLSLTKDFRSKFKSNIMLVLMILTIPLLKLTRVNMLTLWKKNVLSLSRKSKIYLLT